MVKGKPLKNISDARNIVKVMLNGSWVNSPSFLLEATCSRKKL
jgi:hypothetical protein